MPTKSNNTGGRGGKRPGAGRKKKAASEKAANGNPGGRPIQVLDIPDMEGVEMPKPHDFLSADQRDGNPLQAKEIYEETKEAGITVDQLVNNAGAGKQARTVEADPDAMRDLLHLNAVSVTMLSRYFGQDMVKRGSGRIMNVSSMGAFIPDPYFNVYGPTKAYEMFLTKAMYGELQGTGVTVSALCPGPTKTNWAANAGKADSRIAKSPEKAARAGFIGMQEGELIIIPDADYRAVRYLMRPLPAKLQARLIAGWQKGLIERNR